MEAAVTTRFADVPEASYLCRKIHLIDMPKTYTFKVHDDSVNTYGFRMLTSGADLSEFERNPVILLNHNDYDLPIGRATAIRKESDGIYADIEFDSEDPKAKEIEGKVERGFLRMASVGTWPPEEASDDPGLKLQGQTGPTFTRWTLREISICPIGANHNALAMYDRASGKRIDMDGKDAVVRLMDGISNNNNKSERNMSFITKLLKLNDAASDQAIGEELEKKIRLADTLQKEVDTLKAQNKTLSDKLNEHDAAVRKETEAKAVKLIDAAIKDGRLDASGREAWVEDFKRDYATAEARLQSIAPRQIISASVQTEGKTGAGVKLRDMSFNEIIKADRLGELKKDNELYREKFRESYGHYPA